MRCHAMQIVVIAVLSEITFFCPPQLLSAPAQESETRNTRGGKAEAEKTDFEAVQDSLQGVWVAVECLKGGEKLDQPAVPHLAFDRDRFTIREGEQTLQGRFTVDTTTSPAQIVLMRAEGRNALRVSFGLDRGRLTLCFDPTPGAPAPPRLESAADEHWIQVVLAPVLAARLQGHAGPVTAVAFSADAKLLVSGSGWPGGDRTVRVWDAASGKEIRRIELTPALRNPGKHDPNEVPGEVRDLALTPDGKQILVGGAGGFVQLWDIATGGLVRRFEGCGDTVHAVAVSPDGRLVLAGGRDKTIFIWDAGSGEVLRKLGGHGWWVRSLALSPDGRQAISGSFDRTVRLWDVSSGREVRRFPTDGWGFGVAFSPDGRRAVAAIDTDDAEFPVAPLYVWDLETGRQLHRIPAHPTGVTRAAFSPDGRQILSCGYDTTVRLWDADTGRELQRFSGHRDFVWSVAFSPDGRRAVSAGGGRADGGKMLAGEDFAIRLWDLTLITGEKAAAQPRPAEGRSPAPKQ